ncbi:hypothetical protein LY76DRAFT_590184 [Colletotrichum caudatum]|nr:hypothetical protein LY76DRAFT_590184 [Colletotrichum caudatum]
MERTKSAKVSPVSPISMGELLLWILYTTPPWVCPPPALGQPADAFRIERPYQPVFETSFHRTRTFAQNTTSPANPVPSYYGLRPEQSSSAFRTRRGNLLPVKKKCSRQRQRVGGRTEECSSKVPPSSIARGGAVPSLTRWLGILQHHPPRHHQEYPSPPCVNMISNDRL